MSGIAWGVVVTMPDAGGYGLVDCGGARRRCYFPPPYWGATATAAGWGAATVGARVAVAPDARGGLTAIARVGRGDPGYAYTGGQL